MLESIWTRSPWAALAFFAVGLALWETVAARAAVRLGSDLPRRRPFVFGARAGFVFGLAILVYLLSVSTVAFSGVEGSASSAWEKARIAAFPSTWFRGGLATWFDGVLFLIQETILGAACGRFFRTSSLFAPRDAETNDAETTRR